MSPFPTIEFPHGRIINADCLVAMKEMPDNSVDAVVTDPPYGLSTEPDIAEVMQHWINGDVYEHGLKRKGQKNCTANMLHDTIIWDSNDLDLKIIEEFIPFSIRLDQTIVRRPIKLNDNSTVGQEKIGTKSTKLPLKDMLMNESDTNFSKSLHQGYFRLRKQESFSGCIGFCSCYTKGSSSLFSINTRFSTDTFCQPQSAPSIVAFPGAERSGILTFDLSRRTGKLCPTESTFEENLFIHLDGPFNIRTFPATSSLSTKLEAGSVRSISIATNLTSQSNSEVIFSSENSTTNNTTSPDSSLSSIETLPTYFTLLLHKDLLERLTNPNSTTHRGMMSKNWDSFVPGPEYWRECYRILKPGGHIAVFAATRTWDIMSIALRFAGFQNRDTILHEFSPPMMAWVQGQGFPKSRDLWELDIRPEIEKQLKGQGIEGEIKWR